MSEIIGRNDPCHCGSGKKYKKCHLEKDDVKDRKEREKAALNAAKVMADTAEKEGDKKGKDDAASKAQGGQGWMGRMAKKVGFFERFSQGRLKGAKRGG